MQNRYEDAIFAYKEALKLNPSSAECHFNLASAYSDNNQEDLALMHFKESAVYDDLNSETFYNIGVLMIKKKDNDAARHNFQKALLIKPDFTQAIEYLEKINS
jgi:Tfp pilus assembly protein PilF